MEPVAVTTAEGTILVPRLTVQQIIDLIAFQSEQERQSILRDLKDAEATSSEKLARLEQHRKESKLSGTIIRYAFDLDGARKILETALGEIPSSIASLDPSNLSKLALSCLGVDLDEYVEGSSEGKGASLVETS